MPGNPAFSTTNAGQSPYIVAVGQQVQIVGYAKLEVTNSVYAGVYGYLGQYFDAAYTTDSNGNITTSVAGVVSPYGNFLATEPGVVAMVTMPDIDTGERGTCMVYSVSMQVDKNHDGNMDLSFSGPDATLQASPMEFWVNNGNDQPNTSINGGLDFDSQVPPAPPNYAPSQFYPAGHVSCQRDLENFARLWICGIPAISNNYQVTLSWDVTSGNPAINLYNSVETNGGIGYLTDTNIAAQQCLVTLSGSSPYNVTFSGPGVSIAGITPASSFTFPASYFTNGGNQYFIFEGAGVGSGQLMLTIADGNNHTIAETSVWLDLHDIKDFYERAHASNVPNGLPPSSLISQNVIDHTTPTASGETPQVIVFVHGINNTEFAYYDSTETLFKRLYWSGYQGKVAGYRWPCAYLPNDYWNLAEDTRAFNYDKGEFYAWKSGTAFAAYLNYLKARPDLAGYSINILAHSQGNVVASEAIKEGGPFDNYILSQGAIPAHCYDTSLPFLQTFLDAEVNNPTPLDPANGGYHGYFANLTGNLINFYNTNDFALISGTLGVSQTLSKAISWEADQLSEKPENYSYIFGQYYYYHPTYGNSVAYYDFSQYTVTDMEEAKAMVARSRTHAVGAQSGVGGAINTAASVDLISSFGFGNTRDEHSAEFSRPIQTSLSYYQKVLSIIQPPQ